jgi:hypothetical protein
MLWPRGESTVTPEQKARQQRDQQLTKCGWLVQDYAEMDITARRDRM